jgi:general secretion pathway protein H
MTRVRGFTLVELLLVLAIATLLVALVPPLISAALPGVQTKDAARRTVAALRLARETAIRNGADAILVVDVNQRRLELPGYRSVRFPGGLVVSLEGAEREMIDDDRGAIRFFPDGSSTGGRIILARGVEGARTGYEVGVTWLTGRVQVAPWEER